MGSRRLGVEERIGQQLGSYRLVHLLGQGGFADVYLGEHIHLQTLAAVKVLLMRLVGSNLEQFRNEARTIAGLIHPHIVRVLDFGVEDGIPFLVMEYAPHGTLRQAYPEGSRLSPMQIVPYVNQIADALYYAHSRKLIHRDIKPENFLLGSDRKVLLSDFGLVQAAQNTTSQMTKEMAGTIAYMAPEQMNGKPRPASDQYALGVVVYEWLSGKRPFQGSLFEIATQHMLSTPRPLHESIPGISYEIERVVFSALAKDSQQRFPNVKAFAIAFEQACWAMQEATPSVPTTILPLNSSLSPFSTVLISAVSQSGTTNETNDQAQTTASLNNAPPMISPPQTDVPITAPVDSLWPAIQMNTPPQSGESLPFINNSQDQSLAPLSGNNLPGQSTFSKYDNHLYKQSIQPPSVKITSDKPTFQEIANQQSTLVPLVAMAASPIQQAMSTLPALGASILPARRKFSKLWGIVLTLLLLIMVVSGMLVYTLPKTHPASQPSSVHHGSTPSRDTATKDHSPVPVPVVPGFATIQILPSSRDVKNIFTTSAVTGTPDNTQSQVQARQVTASQSQSQTTPTTGSKQTPATRAIGTLSVTCLSPSSPLTINAGTVFTGNDKISVATDTTVTTSGCHTPITAHAVKSGQNGNITAKDIDQPYQGYKVLNETAFSEGQDAKTIAVVAQSDIDTTSAALEDVLMPAVKQALPTKLNANERSFGDPQCTPTATSDHAAGDEATKVTVSMTMSCTVESYDNDGAQARAKALLSNQAANNLGSDYGLIGNITTTIGQPTLVDNSPGTISLPVTAEGVWVYKWSNDQKQYLARKVAGKSAQKVKFLLAGQKGVDAVNLQLSRGDSGMLPSDTSHIRVEVVTIPGL
jgi:serine/threonine protein kinase